MACHTDAEEERFSSTPFSRHPFFTEVNRWIVERVICPSRRTIVDLGCGPGAVTQLIVERLGQCGDAHVIGVDPSASALEKARRAIRSRVAEFMEGSAEWLSRLVPSADAVIFCNAIHLVPDKAKVIAEIRKVLKRGGVLAFNTTFFNGAYVEGTTGFWRRWIVRAVQVLRERGIAVRHEGKATARAFLTPEEYATLCEQEGFSPPTVELVRVAQRRLRHGGRRAAREDETGIARSLRERHEALPPVRRDRDILDQRHRTRRLDPPDFAQHARTRHGDHHHPGGLRLALQRRQLHPERVPDHELFERDPTLPPSLVPLSEPKGPAAPPPDRARGELDEP